MDAVTLDMILDLPKYILERSRVYEEYLDLLRKEVYEQYDIKMIKKDLTQMFNQFKDMKYLYKFPLESHIPVSSIHCIKTTNQISDPTFAVASLNVDKQLWMNDFYYHIICVASKLTLREAIYLVDTFFSNKSEEMICEKLNMCRTTLQNVKKSCLVKVWVEFQ